VQDFAVASQKFTCPLVSAVDPPSTVAARVTTVPEATVVAAAPFEVMASLVVEDTACAPILAPSPKAATNSNNTSKIDFLRMIFLCFLYLVT
jgi:hypothetical protein